MAPHPILPTPPSHPPPSTLHQDAAASIPTQPQPHALLPRQNSNPQTQQGIVPIPTVYQGLNAGPAPGAVVGIVLGSVVGFLFLIWLFWVLSNGNTFIRANRDEEESVVVTQPRRRSREKRSSRRSEMAQQPPPTSRGGRDRVYRSERIVRDFPPAAAGREGSRSRVRESVIVDEPPMRERRVDGDDIVEVIEEHSSVSGAPPPRRKSRRGSGYRSVVPPLEPGPAGGYRPVDPGLYAGGGWAQRPVR